MQRIIRSLQDDIFTYFMKSKSSSLLPFASPIKLLSVLEFTHGIETRDIICEHSTYMN